MPIGFNKFLFMKMGYWAKVATWLLGDLGYMAIGLIAVVLYRYWAIGSLGSMAIGPLGYMAGLLGYMPMWLLG